MAGDSNPLEPAQSLKRPRDGEQEQQAHPPQPILAEDSAVTKAEKIERNGTNGTEVNTEASVNKRLKLEPSNSDPAVQNGDSRDEAKGIVMIKPE